MLCFASDNFKAELIKDKWVTNGAIEVNIFRKRSNRWMLYQKVQLDLTGHYQLKNICTVFQSIPFLERDFKMPQSKISFALKKVKQLTGLRGRWEIISKHPLTICDTAHNVDGMKEVLKQLKTIKYSQIHFVLGMVNDKDVSGILKLLPRKAEYYFCKANIPRGLNVDELAQHAATFGLSGKTFSSVKKALLAAQKVAVKNDLVFVGGSTFTVAEVL